jgi:hypothetical protein
VSNTAFPIPWVLSLAACIRDIPAETGMRAAGDAISAAIQQTQSAVTVIAITFGIAKRKGGNVTDCVET